MESDGLMASDDDGVMASDGVFDIDIAGDMAGADAGDVAPVLSHATRPVAASPNAQAMAINLRLVMIISLSYVVAAVIWRS